MDISAIKRYREVPLMRQQNIELNRKAIDVTSGGYSTMLVDSKTFELSGGFMIDGSFAGHRHDARFIYWHTLRSTMYLVETCLHRNDVWHEVKITFRGSPILSAGIYSHGYKQFFILVVTTTSFHRIPIKHPASTDSNMQPDQDSVLLKLTEHIIKDPMNCHVFINEIAQSPPIAASAMHCAGENYSTFAIATAQSVHLCTMGLNVDKPDVKFMNLEFQMQKLTSFTDHIGASSNFRQVSSTEVVTMCFCATFVRQNHPLLFTLHRDGALRIWLESGQLLAAHNLYKFTTGSKAEFHSSLSRGANSLIALFVSFKTFSEFIVLRPIVTLDAETSSISTVCLENVCTINAPELDLVDFQLCELSLWSLWCDANNEMQTLVYEITSQTELQAKDWQPVVMTSILDDGLPMLPDGTDLQEIYCKRIFNTGLFPLEAIQKTHKMLKENLNDREENPAHTNMMRLKREVIACIKRHIWKEEDRLKQDGSCDSKQLLEISNKLWEKFYQYCLQYTVEALRSIGLFLCEETVNMKLHVSVGLVRKQFVSIIRLCDPLEVAYFSSEHQAVGEMTSINDGTLLLVKYLKLTEESLTEDQKQDLDSYIHQQQAIATEPREEEDLTAELIPELESEHECEPDLGAEDKNSPEVLPASISRLIDSANNDITFEMMRKYGACKMNLAKAVYHLLRLITPEKRTSLSKWEKKHEGRVSVHTGNHLYSELALATTKQIIELRYMMLRNLYLIQRLIRSIQSLRIQPVWDDALIVQSIKYEPRTETLVRCYRVMDCIVNTRLEMDWCRKRPGIIATFPTHNRNTPLTLLQAYTRCCLVHKPHREQWQSPIAIDAPLADIEDCYALSLNQKANSIIRHLSPFHDNFRFGEWLSENDLSIHIDDYFHLVNKWCTTNMNSRIFIKAKSYLLNGETDKALALFLAAKKGVLRERYLLLFVHNNGNGEHRSCSPFEICSTYLFEVIRLFELYGAHDAVPLLVEEALQNTLLPSKQAMFQNIEFSSHMALGRYEKAYKSLSEIVDPARKKDCLRQMISLLLSTRRLDMLMKLPTSGQLLDFTDIVAMNARTADSEDLFRYEFLYSFLADRSFMRDAAYIAFEKAIRYLTVNSSRYDRLQHYCNALLECISCLETVPEWRAWVTRPIIANINQGPQDSTSKDDLEVYDMKKLQELLTTGQSVLALSQSDEDIQLLSSLEPKELIVLLLRRKKYNRALQLAHWNAPSLVTAIYAHLTKACVAVSKYNGNSDMDVSFDNTIADTGLAWLHENCVADVPIGRDSASTAWNYLQYMIKKEPDDLITDAHLAVLTNVILCGSHVPLWLRAWCFENCPVQLVRTYWNHGCSEEVHECMVELFEIRLFTPGRFCHYTAFPLTLYDRVYYELKQSPNHTKDTIDKYLRYIEADI